MKHANSALKKYDNFYEIDIFVDIPALCEVGEETAASSDQRSNIVEKENEYRI